MDTPTPVNYLKIINSICESSEESKLPSELFEKINPALEQLAGYFQSSIHEAFLLAHVFMFNCKGNAADMNDLSCYFDCNPVKIMDYHNHFTALTGRGLLKRTLSCNRVKSVANDQFTLVDEISKAIIKNLPCPEIKPKIYNDIVEILERIYALGNERDEGTITTQDLFDEVNFILDTHIHFMFVQKIKKMEAENADKWLFLYLCWKTIIGKERSDLHVAINGLFDIATIKVYYAQSFMTGNNKLVNEGWVEIEEASFFDDTEIKLSEKGSELLLAENIKLYTHKSKKKNILAPDKIKSKTLFYNQDVVAQMSMLEKSLTDKHLKHLQKRLTGKAMPGGITVLLYGAPGTGKTESVYQIAKRTGRDVMRVDISNSKSMWFGESEKIIKRIFTDYHSFIKQCKRCPILLLNEADAIISKRKDSSSSNVAQTENAIQNIILEELENFQGILFATTNLLHNFDKAFERRFLFKVELPKPEPAIRAAIWESKLEVVTRAECETLAERFDFSGGQIENIVRKCNISEVINGNWPPLAQIMEFCSEELFSKDTGSSIGFTKTRNQPRHILS